MGRTIVGGLVSLVAAGLLLEACAQLPPADLDNICAIFEERPSWQSAADEAASRWQVEVGTILAMIHQESRFRSSARPGWRRAFGVVPLGPRSSAYGYGQVKDGTWSDYQERADRPLARRDRFSDVADFIGWYTDVIHRTAGVSKTDTFHIYLGYHEGPSGYARRSFDSKPWLLGVSRKVDDRARHYARQYATCGGPAVVEGP